METAAPAKPQVAPARFYNPKSLGRLRHTEWM
jgi:hypothetical protein